MSICVYIYVYINVHAHTHAYTHTYIQYVYACIYSIHKSFPAQPRQMQQMRADALAQMMGGQAGQAQAMPVAQAQVPSLDSAGSVRRG